MSTAPDILAPAVDVPASAQSLGSDVDHAERLAQEFDRQRDCWWNHCQRLCEYHDQPEYTATDIPQYASLGGQCYGTLRELALLHTLRPCKDCGSEFLYKSNYQIACCSCFGEDDCPEREDEEDGHEGCHNCAHNMNLPDAITRWNIIYGDTGPVGRVQVLG